MAPARRDGRKGWPSWSATAPRWAFHSSAHTGIASRDLKSLISSSRAGNTTIGPASVASRLAAQRFRTQVPSAQARRGDVNHRNC